MMSATSKNEGLVDLTSYDIYIYIKYENNSYQLSTCFDSGKWKKNEKYCLTVF